MIQAMRAAMLALAVAFGATTAALAQEPPPTAQDDPAAMYQGLRRLALETRPDDLGLTPAPGQPYGVLMEFELGGATVTVAAFATGDASLYFSTGGGVIGGIGHETVKSAAQRFVAEAGAHTAAFAPGGDLGAPGPREIRFIILTPEGPASATVPESAVVAGSHPLTGLADAGQDVITQYRLATERNAAAN